MSCKLKNENIGIFIPNLGVVTILGVCLVSRDDWHLDLASSIISPSSANARTGPSTL